MKAKVPTLESDFYCKVLVLQFLEIFWSAEESSHALHAINFTAFHCKSFGRLNCVHFYAHSIACHLPFDVCSGFCFLQFCVPVFPKKTLPYDALFRKGARFHIGCTKVHKTESQKARARKKESIRMANTYYLCGSGGTFSTSALAWLSNSLYRLNIKSNDLTFTPASSCLKSFVFVNTSTNTAVQTESEISL